jgi:hypothetical protein
VAFYDDVLPLLRNPSAKEKGQVEPRSGQKVWSFCPCHPDGQKAGRRSLSLHPKFGLKCWTGCDRNDVLEALGYRNQQSREERASRNGYHGQPTQITSSRETREKKATDLGPPENEWVYRDDHGRPIAIHGRFPLKPEGKTFRWRLPTNLEWSGLGEDLSERDLPPYGLEDLLDEDLRDEPVLTVEGEKARDCAKANGFKVVLSWGGGSDQRFFPKYYLRFLKGRNLIFWPDNDVHGWAFMNRLAITTRAIANSQQMLLAPGAGEKEDAYDWFVVRGRSLQAIYDSLAGTITQPTTAFIDSTTIKVALPPVNEKSPGPVEMLFSHIQTMSDKGGVGLTAKLEVSPMGPAAEQYPYTQRINVLSRPNREACSRELRDMFGKDYEWPRLLNTATVLVDRGYATRDRGIDMAAIPDTGGLTWHIERHYELGHISMVFGDRAAMKSLQVQYSVICAALGMDVADTFGTLPGPWGWLDYEQEPGSFKRRGRRLLEGLGIDEVLSNLIHYYPSDGLPIFDLLPGMASYAERHGLVGWVIDSGIPMVGGDPNDNGLVSNAFNELQKLKLTTVIIGHVVKGAAAKSTESPLGANAWGLRPSYLWYVDKFRVHDDNLTKFRAEWINRKVRDTSQVKDFSLLWTFDDPEGPITVEPTQRLASTNRDPETRLVELLRSSAPMSKSAIADELMLSERTVTRIFNRDPDFFVRTENPDTATKGGRGKKTHWTIRPNLTNSPVEDLPFDFASDPELRDKLIPFPGSTPEGDPKP